MVEDFKRFENFEKAYNYMMDRITQRRHHWTNNKILNPLEKIKSLMYIDIVYNTAGNYFAVVDRIGDENFDYEAIGCVKVMTMYWDAWYYVGETREAIAKGVPVT